MVGLLFSPLQSFLVFHISMIILGLILIPNVFIFNLNYLSIQFAITCTYNLAILGCSQSRELFYNHEKNMFKSVIFVDLLHALDFQDQKLSMCIGLLKNPAQRNNATISLLGNFILKFLTTQNSKLLTKQFMEQYLVKWGYDSYVSFACKFI